MAKPDRRAAPRTPSRSSKAALCIAALCGACASLYQMNLPSEGRDWFALRSQHFELQTDLDEPGARGLVDELERRRQALIDAAWRGATFAPFTTRVVALRDTDEMAQFAGSFILGYWRRDLFGEKEIVFPADRGRGNLGFDGLRVATHELVHDLASRYFARQPRWLAEGLARFLETMELDEKENRASIGGLSDYQQASGGYGSVASRDWYAQVGQLFDPQGFVDESLAGRLVFFLINREPRAFDCFQRALYRGDPADGAWQSCFPAYATAEGRAQLGARLLDYFHADDIAHKVSTVPSAPYTGEVALRKMNDAEVRVLRAGLLLLGPHLTRDDRADRTRAQADVDAALASDPSFAPALALRVQLLSTREEKLAAARWAAQARPGDWQALALVDQAMGDAATPAEEAERGADLEKAAALAPGSAWVLERLARSRVRAGHADEAIALVRRSLALDPDSAPGLDAAAMVADAQGDCTGALALARMAVERLPRVRDEQKAAAADTPLSAQWEEQMQQTRARLARYESQCAAVR